MPTRTDINCTTGEVTEIELTPEEVAQMEKDAADYEALKAERAAAQAAAQATKEAAHAKLAAIGLTPEEIAAL
jgi:hypothetical protein